MIQRSTQGEPERPLFEYSAETLFALAQRRFGSAQLFELAPTALALIDHRRQHENCQGVNGDEQPKIAYRKSLLPMQLEPQSGRDHCVCGQRQGG